MTEQYKPLLQAVRWPAPASVQAAYSTRQGGVSVGAYRSLNLGDHVGDSLVDVVRNRELVGAALGAQPVYLQQVHGWEHVMLQADTPDKTVADLCSSRVRVEEGGRVCCIMVADCLPVLMCNRDGTWVGAAHAGWRGLLGGDDGVGVIEQLVEQAGGGELMAWLGPCIGPNRFEVGVEVRDAFMARQSQVEVAFRPVMGVPGKFLCDLGALARERLHKLGVRQIFGNDGSVDWCTHSQEATYFSHRRDRVSGRQAAFIWLA